jgi:hypothetical protein
MEDTYLRIMDDFDARHIFDRLQFYSRDASHSKEVIFGGLKGDRVEHKWEEETLEFLELQTKVKMTFYTLPTGVKGELPRHTLEMEISGEDKAKEKTLEKLWVETGIEVAKYKS